MEKQKRLWGGVFEDTKMGEDFLEVKNLAKSVFKKVNFFSKFSNTKSRFVG